MSLSTHVLDCVSGGPAVGVAVTVERRIDEEWQQLGSGATDADGRIGALVELSAGTHRMTFDSGGYFHARDVETFYPQVVVVFDVTDPKQHHHVPLLLSPFSYSTYRGS
ncbi:MAG TPA: hydroxyisourate hydrolase [Mycobacteriales bacterium]|jgi:hydroxyisourate hydrolase|nr:hydroxyisourate hydrolase [Mycobacteriales bacterium]